jgi:Mitochondrial carrier protein
MEKGNFMQEFIAGNVGGLIGICVVYPLDTAKIRMQTQKHYKSTSDVLRTMVRIDGIGSLYRGLASPALGFGLTFAISFRLLKQNSALRTAAIVKIVIRLSSDVFELLVQHIWPQLPSDSRFS